MPDPINPVAGIVGSLDGKTPVYQPEGRWCWWNIDEIYLGTIGENRYVPKVNDLVMDIPTGVIYIVTHIDPTTLLSTLNAFKVSTDTSTTLTNTDLLLGVSKAIQSDTYICYLDQTVTPHILAVDRRYMVPGSMCSYVKIFKGADVSSSGQVIGFLIDTAGNYLTDKIPLELCTIDSHDNISIKTPSVGYTNVHLPDGELVTVVTYDDAGHVIFKRQMMIENTGFIRNVGDGIKYISHITIETPFLSNSNDHLIEYPLNLPLQGIALVGVVHYSDGSTIKLPVDGTKFAAFGLDTYVSTIPGQMFDIVIKYNLSPGEAVYGSVGYDNKVMTEAYRLKTTDADGSYLVKLFCTPVWIDNVNGYRLDWYLLNLDRDIVHYVTPWVRINDNSPAFRPTEYGTRQSLSVSINLKNVSGSFLSYIHVQTVDITLITTGSDRSTNWTVAYDPGQNPAYGVNTNMRVNMIDANNNKVRVASGATTLQEWLDKFYYSSKPLVNLQTETVPPEPNYFAIRVGNYRTVFNVSRWNTELTLTHPVTINSTAVFEFIKRTASGDLILAVSGVPVYEIQ